MTQEDILNSNERSGDDSGISASRKSEIAREVLRGSTEVQRELDTGVEPKAIINRTTRVLQEIAQQQENAPDSAQKNDSLARQEAAGLTYLIDQGLIDGINDASKIILQELMDEEIQADPETAAAGRKLLMAVVKATSQDSEEAVRTVQKAIQSIGTESPQSYRKIREISERVKEQQRLREGESSDAQNNETQQMDESTEVDDKTAEEEGNDELQFLQELKEKYSDAVSELSEDFPMIVQQLGGLASEDTKSDAKEWLKDYIHDKFPSFYAHLVSLEGEKDIDTGDARLLQKSSAMIVATLDKILPEIEKYAVEKTDEFTRKKLVALFTRMKLPPEWAHFLAEKLRDGLEAKIDNVEFNLKDFFLEKMLTPILFNKIDGTPDQRSALSITMSQVIQEIRAAQDQHNDEQESDNDEPDNDGGDGGDAGTGAGAGGGDGSGNGAGGGTGTGIATGGEDGEDGGAENGGGSESDVEENGGAEEDVDGGGETDDDEESEPDAEKGKIFELQRYPEREGLSDEDAFFMDKHDVTRDVESAKRYVLQRVPDRYKLSDADITEKALAYLENDKYGRRIQTVKAAGSSKYYIEFDARDYEECREFGGNSESIIVQFTLAQKLGNYTSDEQMVLRTFDTTRKFEPDRETYFEEFFLFKLQQANPKTIEETQEALQEIYEKYREIYRKVYFALQGSVTQTDPKDKQERSEEYELHDKMTRSLTTIAQNFGKGFNNPLVLRKYNLIPTFEFKVSTKQFIVSENPAQVDQLPEDQLQGGAQPLPYRPDVTKSFEQAIKDELVPISEQINKTIAWANRGREIVHKQGGDKIQEIVSLAGSIENPSIVTDVIRGNDHLSRAMQIYMKKLQQVGASVERIPSVDFGALNPASGLEEAEHRTVQAMLLELGDRPDKLSEDEILKEAQKRARRKLFKKSSKSGETGTDGRVPFNKKRFLEETVRQRSVVKAEELRKDKRYYSDVETVVKVASGLHKIYTGEFFSFIFDMVDEEALTTYTTDEDGNRVSVARTFEGTQSGLAELIAEAMAVEKSQYGQGPGAAATAITVGRVLGSNPDATKQSQIDILSLDKMKQRSRRNLASDNNTALRRLLSIRESALFAHEILDVVTGDIMRIDGFRTAPVQHQFIEQIVRDAEGLSGMERYDHIMENLFQFGGTRPGINYIKDNINKIMQEDPEFANVVERHEEIKDQFENELRRSYPSVFEGASTFKEAVQRLPDIKDKFTKKLEEDYALSLIEVEKAQSQAKRKYFKKFIFDKLIWRSPAHVMLLQHKSLTVEKQTIRQRMLEAIIRDDRIDPSSNYALNVIMPNFELVAQAIGDKFWTEERNLSGDDLDALYQRLEDAMDIDQTTSGTEEEARARAIFKMYGDDLRSGFIKLVEKDLQSRGSIRNPKTGEFDDQYRDPRRIYQSDDDISYRQQAEILADVVFGTSDREGLYSKLIDQAFTEHVTVDQDGNERFDTMSGIFAEHMAYDLGSYDSQLTGHMFDYGKVDFVGTELIKGVIGNLETRKNLKEQWNEIFGDGKLLHQIYNDKNPITEENLQEIATKIAEKIREAVKVKTKNPQEIPLLQSQLAVAAVKALSGSGNEKNIWNLDGDDPGNLISEPQMQYELLNILLQLLTYKGPTQQSDEAAEDIFLEGGGGSEFADAKARAEAMRELGVPKFLQSVYDKPIERRTATRNQQGTWIMHFRAMREMGFNQRHQELFRQVTEPALAAGQVGLDILKFLLGDKES